MKLNEQFIMDFLAFKAGRPLKIKDLAREMEISARDYSSFRGMVKSLLDSGRLVKLRRGRIGVPSELNLVVSHIAIQKRDHGTIVTDAGEVVPIDQAKLHTALDGDKVMVRVNKNRAGELEGTVLKVLERANKSFVGIFQRGKHFSTVIPDARKFRRNVYIPNALSKDAGDGERVVVTITLWEDPYRNPEGQIEEVLGKPGEQGVDLQTVIRSFNLPGEFSTRVLSDAKEAARLFNDEEIQRRRDFSSEVIYTIDPADAKDHDDAVSVSKTSNGYRLGVYIADVSYFVRPGTALEKEAFNRGNSVYLPGMVIPMLPEELSNDLCSLKPNRRRLVYAVLMDFSDRGRMLNWEIVEGVIRSRAKLSYEEVQEFFDGRPANSKIDRVADNLTVARELARLLQSQRMAEGSLDFDLPEPLIIMNKKGEIIEIGNRVRLESHRLIEEFMLAANKAVALHMSRLGLKFLYRVHDRPDLEKLEAFSYMMTTLGYKFPVSDKIKPLQFSRFLETIKGRPEEEFINELMLRSMKKAVYQPVNVGHFGLAFKHYAHFTSPIRRFPDLIVHRLLKKVKNRHYPVKFEKGLDTILTNIGRHCSDTERTAEAAEREAIKYKQVMFMSRKIGEHYRGVISGVLNFGFFVRLENIGVEGMIRLSTLDDDYYQYDEKHYRLVGRRTKRVLRLGDPVEVGVLAVDKVKNEIDLYLLDYDADKLQPEGEKPKKHRKHKRRERK
nr:ribonuclease R [candidate division Zixibacteria bacterium]